ncbi:protein NIM1-INTERACTING 2 [Prunus avium]|uniref:Protein NIM1-INTERACTING 2 n=1 Tax=Prunus avium TaxID=42229 RepID=A0A6P5SJH1_PRUAV|nr:protein NIM1-INTERACTING 2 [Prunus avium]
MDGEKRKQDDRSGVEAKKAKVEGDHRETVTEEEVEEFFAILRRIHVAAKHLGKTNDRLTSSMKWRPSFEVQDFEEDNINLIKDHKDGEKKAEGDFSLDLNSHPETESIG